MKRPSDDTLRALAMLEREPRFTDFLRWIEESQAESSERCENARDEIDVRQAQGSARELRELLQYAREARALLESRNR